MKIQEFTGPIRPALCRSPKVFSNNVNQIIKTKSLILPEERFKKGSISINSELEKLLAGF